MEAKLNDTDEDVGVINIGGELFWWYRDAQGLWLLYHVHDLESILAPPPDLLSWSDLVGVTSTGVSLRSMARGHLAQNTRPS